MKTIDTPIPSSVKRGFEYEWTSNLLRKRAIEDSGCSLNTEKLAERIKKDHMIGRNGVVFIESSV